MPLPDPPAFGTDAALFLDLDGTLLDFAARPADVIIEQGLPDMLARLHAALGGALAIVSGRSLAEIDALSGMPYLAAAGLHGAQIRDAHGHIEFAPASAGTLDAVRQHTIALTERMPGVLIEDKIDAIALHYRAVPELASAVELASFELLRIAGSGYTLQHGNHVVELKSASCDKGTAIDALMDKAPFSGRVPWMVGDDLTDEHAFLRVNARGGFSVIVGDRRPSIANHALPGPDAVRRWLALTATTFDSRAGDSFR
jgi:trehalose 6-phosphate phosphatase